ncbi:MAG: hypothetical protein ACI857_000027 [Arenicella sp.]|jgi:hypothetical protein
MRAKIIKISTVILFIGLISTFVSYKSHKKSGGISDQIEIENHAGNLNDVLELPDSINNPFDSTSSSRLSNSIANLQRIEALNEVQLEVSPIIDWERTSTNNDFRAFSSKTLMVFDSDDIFPLTPSTHPPSTIYGDSIVKLQDSITIK